MRWHIFDFILVIISLVQLGLADVEGLFLLRSFLPVSITSPSPSPSSSVLTYLSVCPVSSVSAGPLVADAPHVFEDRLGLSGEPDSGSLHHGLHVLCGGRAVVPVGLQS